MFEHIPLTPQPAWADVTAVNSRALSVQFCGPLIAASLSKSICRVFTVFSFVCLQGNIPVASVTSGNYTGHKYMTCEHQAGENLNKTLAQSQTPLIKRADT